MEKLLGRVYQEHNILVLNMRIKMDFLFLKLYLSFPYFKIQLVNMILESVKLNFAKTTTA